MNKPTWCPYCSHHAGDFENEVKQIVHKQNGQLLSRYQNAVTHVRVKCNIHNYEWDIMPLNIKKEAMVSNMQFTIFRKGCVRLLD
ncbi:hypothetical protein IRP61_11405 (plasmid) [Clostridium botulinum]|nr:hypothetical protein [Clostridium botulinum]QPW56475.1 hypothetical protein IRP61_11405 [Clostridium botulinum]